MRAGTAARPDVRLQPATRRPSILVAFALACVGLLLAVPMLTVLSDAPVDGGRTGDDGVFSDGTELGTGGQGGPGISTRSDPTSVTTAPGDATDSAGGTPAGNLTGTVGDTAQPGSRGTGGTVLEGGAARGGTVPGGAAATGSGGSSTTSTGDTSGVTTGPTAGPTGPTTGPTAGPATGTTDGTAAGSSAGTTTGTTAGPTAGPTTGTAATTTSSDSESTSSGTFPRRKGSGKRSANCPCKKGSTLTDGTTSTVDETVEDVGGGLLGIG